MAWSNNSVSGCASDRPNRWFWDQVLKNTGGTRISLTERVNFFDGGQVSKPTGFTINIDPGATHTQSTSWCSSLSGDHTFRTDWSGSDAGGGKVAVTGPTVTLKKQ